MTREEQLEQALRELLPYAENEAERNEHAEKRDGETYGAEGNWRAVDRAKSLLGIDDSTVGDPSLVTLEEPQDIDTGQAVDLVAALNQAYAIAKDREFLLMIESDPFHNPPQPWQITALHWSEGSHDYDGPKCASLEIALECFLEAYQEPPLKVSTPLPSK